MLAKLKIVAFILLFCTFSFAGQQDTLPLSLTSPQEEAQLLGIDVSQFQGNIDWDQVKQNEQKISFVFVRASGGTDHVDPYFKRNWPGAKRAGILRGPSHSFNPKQDAKAQARLLIKTVKKLGENDLPPLLDLESNKFDEVDEVAYENFIARLFIWLEEVEKELGAKPIIYVSPGFARDYLADRKFSRYTLVAAEYDTVSAAPKMWGAWEGKTWTFWQYSDNGTVKGIIDKVDLDKFNGSARELIDFVKNSRKEEIEEIEVTLTAEKSKEPPPVEEKKETPAKKEPETPIINEEKEPPLLKTGPGTPTVETTSFSDEINLGNINFPRDFIHQKKDYKKGVYPVKLIRKEEGEIPYFHVYDRENQLLFEEMALVIPRKGKLGTFKYRVRKRLLENEYFMIRVTQPDQHIYAFFFIKK